MKRAITLLIPALVLTAGFSAADDAKEQKKDKKCSNEAMTCIRDMAAGLKKRGWIGIEWNYDSGRPTITHVVDGSPAAAAGVRLGDVVMTFGGVATDEEDEVVWAAMKSSLVPGKTVTLGIVRDGSPLELAIELVAVPDHIIAQWVGKHVLQHHVAAADTDAPASP